MKREIADTIITALQFQNIAKNYLQYAKSLCNGNEVGFINTLLNRLEANERQCKLSITSEKGKAAFDSEIVKTDALLYSNIFLHLIECSQEQKDTIEKLVIAIHKGEMIEMVEPENKY